MSDGYHHHVSPVRTMARVVLAIAITAGGMFLAARFISKLDPGPPQPRKWNDSVLLITAMDATECGVRCWIANAGNEDYVVGDYRTWTIYAVEPRGMSPLEDAKVQVPILIPSSTVVAVTIKTASRPAEILILDTSNKFKIRAVRKGGRP